jgi:uncharacterized protein
MGQDSFSGRCEVQSDGAVDRDESGERDETRDARYARLQEILRQCGSVCIGYSGGVDSVFLAKVAVDTLGADHVLAVTGRSESYPQVQRDVAIECSQQFGIPHVEIHTDELNDPNYAANPSNRCYFCKSELWTQLRRVADERGLKEVLDGSNADDAGEYRPGIAAAKERAVRSPLLDAGLTKADIRALSHELGLPTWDQPAAPCLSSRLPYGLAVTTTRLREVEDAETAVRALGFSDFRVRHHGDAARIEVPAADIERALALAAVLDGAVRAAGFTRVLLDVEGYRRGALNEGLVRLGSNVTPRIAVERHDSVVDDGSPVEAAGHTREIAVLAMHADASPSQLAARAAAVRRAGYRYAAVDLARVVAAQPQPHSVARTN